jgi:hypothetical protein
VVVRNLRPEPRNGRHLRLFYSFVASGVLNLCIWAAVAWLARIDFYEAVKQQPREQIAATSPVRIEHRIPRALQRAKPRHRTPVRAALPEGPSLSVPSGWEKHDIGHEGMQDAALWLDWSKQTAEFVPRVFLWQKPMMDADGRRLSLREAVHDVVAYLHDEGDKLFESRAQPVCGGRRLGWFLSYDKPEDDPPVHIDDIFLMDGTTVYRATYARPIEQKEDVRTRRALSSLC